MVRSHVDYDTPMSEKGRMRTIRRVLLCLSALALVGTLVMPPIHEAAAQPHWKKSWKKKGAWKKGAWKKGAGKKGCAMQFTPGGRMPKRVCG